MTEKLSPRAKVKIRATVSVRTLLRLNVRKIGSHGTKPTARIEDKQRFRFGWWLDNAILIFHQCG
jgi:hypothetical protein